MATDATGTPTSNGIPTYLTSADKPSGNGFNAAMAAIDTLITNSLNTVVKKAGTIIGTRRAINFIEGSGIALTVADDSGNNEVDVTIASSAVGGEAVPIGAILEYGGSTPPDSNYLMADGSAVSRTTYSTLFARYGTTHGSGDGSTTFNLPDRRQRVGVGKHSSGTFATLGAKAGEETHALTTAELAVHNHGISNAANAGHTHTGSGTTSTKGADYTNYGGGGGVPTFNATDAHSHTYSFTTSGESGGSAASIANAGSGTAHNNLQPYIVLNYIIRAL